VILRPMHTTAVTPATNGDRRLEATTAEGAALVASAESLAERFAPGATEHDRLGTFAAAHLEILREERFLSAPIPTELGGGGVSSIHDVLVAMSRLAEGDPSTTIGVNMHLAVLLNVLRSHGVLRHRGEHARAAALGEQLRLVVDAGVVFAGAVSEPSPQDLTRPRTTATRVDGGWRVDGRKAFATMAPAATILNVAVTYRTEGGEERYGFALVPAGAPGVTFPDDWDALGMRGSASGSVVFDDVRIEAGAVRDGFPTGVHSAALLERFLTSGAFHAAASLGIAESAHAHVLTSLRKRSEAAAADPFVIVRLAENVVDLSAMRASFDRAGHAIDRHVAAHPDGDVPMAAAVEAYGEVQASKAFLTAAAVRVVDRALALSGGAGYLQRDPLAKAWRDVRAGGFMHPIGANRADLHLARTALGLDPV
jgi:alkylation response protein AidB-like acyl-CoA dehydrogenase